MVHGKRATLLPEDVEYAMEALNVEVSKHVYEGIFCRPLG